MKCTASLHRSLLYYTVLLVLQDFSLQGRVTGHGQFRFLFCLVWIPVLGQLGGVSYSGLVLVCVWAPSGVWNVVLSEQTWCVLSKSTNVDVAAIPYTKCQKIASHQATLRSSRCEGNMTRIEQHGMECWMRTFPLSNTDLEGWHCCSEAIKKIGWWGVAQHFLFPFLALSLGYKCIVLQSVNAKSSMLTFWSLTFLCDSPLRKFYDS